MDFLTFLITFIIPCLIATPIFIMCTKQIKKDRELKEEINNIKEDISNFEDLIYNKYNIDYALKYKKICVYVDYGRRKVFFYGYEPYEFKFSDIVSIVYNYHQHQEFYTKSESVANKKSSIKKAIVGDVLFGPAGAIIGGTSGKTITNTTSTTHSSDVVDNMSITIYLGEYGQIEFNFLEDEEYYSLNYMNQEEAYRKLEGIFKMIENTDQRKENKTGSSKRSIKKELKELKELLDENLITQLEYNKRRKKILDE